MFHTAFETQNIPLSVVEDGNYLYRAASLAISGSEHLHKLLELMTAIEMILNKTTYNQNDDNGNLTEEDGNEDNPAKVGLEVGKFLDTSKKKGVTWLEEGGLTSRLPVAEYSGTFPGLAPLYPPLKFKRFSIRIFTGTRLCNDRNKGHVTERQTTNYL
ncbi:hypothetical protein CHS0354_033634 [Potamilus streckersoni]|uniref:Uncharacterized protein n=1 Tax=Potamilus streckersoni TaxID=2493646 RepID=A0AAE0SRV3_9BIVA|nr:hypothetical protein CHS0354_033634 [Potamilus streckersoni]